MRRAVAAFALAGNHVIIDDLLFRPITCVITLKCWRSRRLADRRPLFLAVVNQRESQRSGRFPGTATSHYHQVTHMAASTTSRSTPATPPREPAQNR